MKAETIQRLVNKAVKEGKDAGRIVTDFITKEQDVQRIINSIIRQKTKLIEEHNKQLVKLNHDLIELQKTCPHLEHTYYPDASGNNDNSTICDWCGKEL